MSGFQSAKLRREHLMLLQYSCKKIRAGSMLKPKVEKYGRFKKVQPLNILKTLKIIFQSQYWNIKRKRKKSKSLMKSSLILVVMWKTVSLVPSINKSGEAKSGELEVGLK